LVPVVCQTVEFGQQCVYQQPFMEDKLKALLFERRNLLTALLIGQQLKETP